MGKVDYKFLNLTFISSEEEIKRQITNTVIFFFLEEKFNEVVELSELLESTQYGYNTSALSSGENKFLRISDIKDGKVNWDTVPFCDCTDEKNYLLYSKDILVARTGGTTGKSFLINNPPAKSVFAGYLIRLRTNKKLLPEFLNLFLNSYAYWSQISEMKSGSAQPNVNAEKLKQLLIPYCSVELQKEILSLLKDFNTEKKIWKELLQTILDVQKKFKKNNEVTELLTTQQTLITQLRQSILQEAVQGKLVKQNKNDEPASELLKGIKAEKDLPAVASAKAGKLIKQGKLKKEKPLPQISENEIPYQLPEGWVWCRLGEIVEYGSSPKAESKDLKDNTWILELEDIEPITSKLLRKTFFKERKSLSTKNVFSQGDVLYSKLRPYLDKVIIADDNGVCSSEILPIKYPKEIYSEYLRLRLKAPDFIKYANSKVYGMNLPRLGTDDARNCLFPFPPHPEQKRIVEKVNQLMQHCKELEQQVQQSITHAKQLMQAVLREVFEKKKEMEQI